MKKVIVCLTIMTSLLVGTALLTNAETADVVRLERKHYIAEDGTKMTDITVNTNFACGGFEGVLKYDGQNLDYVKFTDYVGNSRNTKALSTRDTADGIRSVVLGYAKTGTQGNFVTFTFEGTSTEDFGIKQAIFADAQGNEVDAKVYDVMLGDATGDFNVDVYDLVRMKKHNEKQECDADIWNSDCDRNGAVEDNDLVQLRRFLCSDIAGF